MCFSKISSQLFTKISTPLSINYERNFIYVPWNGYPVKYGAIFNVETAIYLNLLKKLTQKSLSTLCTQNN